MHHPSCALCGGNLRIPHPAMYDFPTITSDCRPWPAGRAVAICEDCGTMQRTLLPEATTRIADVYTDYTMFKHSNISSDQLTFGEQGIGQARTEKILQYIANKLIQTPTSVLDVGSGSGAGLIALGTQFPAAKIYGFEPNDRPAERQSAMPANVVSIVNTLPSRDTNYDLVTLFHVLEHVEETNDLLGFIRDVLSPDGMLLIQVPYPIRNPFDYVISDHVWHFTKQSMVALLQKANFSVQYIGNGLIEKELTVLASPNAAMPTTIALPPQEDTLDSIAWVLAYKAFLDTVKAAGTPCAVYGTGPAGAWAGHVLGDLVVAYIDDDPARIDAHFNGKPVIPANRVAPGMAVIAPFPDHQFSWIVQKNASLNILQRSAA